MSISKVTRRRCETCRRAIQSRDDGTLTIHTAVGGGYCTGSDTTPTALKRVKKSVFGYAKFEKAVDVNFGPDSGTSKVLRTGVRTLADKPIKRKMSAEELAAYKVKKLEKALRSDKCRCGGRIVTVDGGAKWNHLSAADEAGHRNWEHTQYYGGAKIPSAPHTLTETRAAASISKAAGGTAGVDWKCEDEDADHWEKHPGECGDCGGKFEDGHCEGEESEHWPKWEHTAGPRIDWSAECGHCGSDMYERPRVQKSVPYGTRPFARRALPKQAVKQTRASAPRYGIKKSNPMMSPCPSRDTGMASPHIIDVNKEGVPQCAMCSQVFPNVRDWWQAKKSFGITGVYVEVPTEKAEGFLSKSNYPCPKCKGFTGNALQVLKHAKGVHPLATRIETQKNAVKKSHDPVAAAAAANWPKCPGCGKPTDVLGMMDSENPVCMGCVRARHRTAVNGGRCACGVRKNPGQRISTASGRQWIPCNRCLGTAQSLNDRCSKCQNPNHDWAGHSTDDDLCGLPNCGHTLKRHIPADDGSPACYDCNDKRPRRNVRHTFRGA